MKTTTLDTWFSRFIRLRDADENRIAKCCTCGRYADVKTMDNGHYIKRQHTGVRYNEINCNTQCKRCNNFEQGNDVKYRDFLVKKYGEEKILLLESMKKSTTKLHKFEIEAMVKHYKSEVARLLIEKNIEKWW